MDLNLNTIREVEEISISSSYICSPELCTTYISNNFKSIKIFHTNIRSINKNLDDLLVLLKRTNIFFDVIILSECWLSKCPVIPPITGYRSFKTNHVNQNDGVIAYVRDDLACSVESSDISDANCLILKFFNELAIIALYRSPSYKNLDNFMDGLDGILGSLRSFKSVAIIGDLNIDIANQNGNNNCDKYLNLITSHGLLPGHVFPTRNDSCIDHIVIKSHQLVKVLVLDTCITDHAPVILNYDLVTKSLKTKSTVRRFDELNCITDLETSDFSHILNSNDPEQATNSLIEAISSSVIKNSYTVVIPSGKRIIKPWITPGLLRCIKNRDKLFLKTKKYPNSSAHKITYSRYRNFCNNLLKKLKTEYERLEFQKASNNPKETWKVIRHVANMGIDPSSSHELLTIDRDPVASVNKVNKYFANIGRDLASRLSTISGVDGRPQKNLLSNINLEAPQQPDSMALYNTDIEEVEQVIVGLRNTSAVGWDGIPTSLIKSARHVLLPALTHIFNLCLSSGAFPKCLKRATVCPIYKAGDRGSVENYRPISVLTVVSKILEKLLNRRLLSYLKRNSKIACNQFGFREGKSTEDAVLELTDTIVKNINDKTKTIGIFLDLSRAFDTVSVPILLKKMENLGIREHALDIFRSYLSDRTQCVKIEGFTSMEEGLSFGVPQGSVLGPTLFNIYLNDLCRINLSNCKIITYADDTVLLIQGESWRAARLSAESALRMVMLWLSLNLLTLNIKKSKFITFGAAKLSLPPCSFQIIAHNCLLSAGDCCCGRLMRTSSIKYLGIMIDDMMTWNAHVNMTVSRVRKLIYVFKKLRPAADIQTLRTVYHALAQSIITYCIAAWGGCAKTLLLRLERAQRAVLKVIMSKPVRFPTTQIYSLYRVLTVRQLFILSVVLRKHSQTPFDPQLNKDKRKREKVCKVETCKVVLSRRHYHFLSPIMYNKINKKLNIFHCTLHQCKRLVSEWLLALTYEQTESFLGIML